MAAADRERAETRGLVSADLLKLAPNRAQHAAGIEETPAMFPGR
jgi:hypothetical protein